MIRKSIPEISEKMLIQNLKELELDQIIERQAKPIIPPHVTYALSAKGMDLIPIFNAMAHWGNQYSKTEKKESSALKPMVNPAKKDI
jgi:DNA-binding HxlR family transcriptional regulator